MNMKPEDVEIIYRGGIYDIYVRGRYRDFYSTFGQAVRKFEELTSKSPGNKKQEKECELNSSRFFQAS